VFAVVHLGDETKEDTVADAMVVRVFESKLSVAVGAVIMGVVITLLTVNDAMLFTSLASNPMVVVPINSYVVITDVERDVVATNVGAVIDELVLTEDALIEDAVRAAILFTFLELKPMVEPDEVIVVADTVDATTVPMLLISFELKLMKVLSVVILGTLSEEVTKLFDVTDPIVSMFLESKEMLANEFVMIPVDNLAAVKVPMFPRSLLLKLISASGDVNEPAETVLANTLLMLSRFLKLKLMSDPVLVIIGVTTPAAFRVPTLIKFLLSTLMEACELVMRGTFSTSAVTFWMFFKCL